MTSIMANIFASIGIKSLSKAHSFNLQRLHSIAGMGDRYLSLILQKGDLLFIVNG